MSQNDVTTLDMVLSKIDEALVLLLPVWEEIIKGLGYDEQKAKVFAQSYWKGYRELPPDRKIKALLKPSLECMVTAFREAGIDMLEAFQIYRRILEEDEET